MTERRTQIRAGWILRKTGTEGLKRLRVCFCVTGPGRLLGGGGTPYVSVAPDLLRAPLVPRWPERTLLTQVWADVLQYSGAVMSFKCLNQHCRIWCRPAQINEAFNSNFTWGSSLRPLEVEGLLLKYFLILYPWMELLKDGLCAPWTKKKTFPLFPIQIFHKQNKGTNQKFAFFWNIFDNISVIMRIYFRVNKVCSVVTIWYH